MDESHLRHPWEHTIFAVSVVLNLGIMIGAFLLLRTADAWLKEHPLLNQTLKYVEALAIAALFAPVAIVLVRNARRSFIQGNAVRLSAQQMPDVYDVLERHCRRLGIDPIPALYVSDRAIDEPAHAFSTWQQDYIVLAARFLKPKAESIRDVLAFTLGRELGRIRLGYTRWWYELLLAYVIKIPYLSNPVTQVETLSLDRYGAFLAPEGVRGLVVQASGRRLLPVVNLEDYLGQVHEYGGFWAFLANLAKSKPHIAYRIGALVKAGLFKAGMGAATVPEVTTVKSKEMHHEHTNLMT